MTRDDRLQSHGLRDTGHGAYLPRPEQCRPDANDPALPPTPPGAPAPLKSLRFLYIGSTDVPRDLAWYVRILGGQKLWCFNRFGAVVAAMRLGEGPLLLLASHRPAGSCMLIYDVDSLDSAAALLKSRGWTPVAERIDIPNGPCTTFDDPTGNHLAIFEDQHPDKMAIAYADPANSAAVRD